MTTESANSTDTAEALEAIRRELARLSERVAALERAARPVGAALPPARPVAPPPEELSEEIILVLSAAVAAFLGKKAPIRQIHLVGSTAWAQQGRVLIQASHSK